MDSNANYSEVASQVADLERRYDATVKDSVVTNQTQLSLPTGNIRNLAQHSDLPSPGRSNVELQKLTALLNEKDQEVKRLKQELEDLSSSDLRAAVYVNGNLITPTYIIRRIDELSQASYLHKCSWKEVATMVRLLLDNTNNPATLSTPSPESSSSSLL